MRSFGLRLPALLFCLALPLRAPAADGPGPTLAADGPVAGGLVAEDASSRPGHAGLEVEGGFPIAVWLQDPRNAGRYKAIGINLYVGLWRGPTAEQLDELEKHSMPVVCSQNSYARSHLDRKIIVGWMHGDEPDNAQSLGRGKGYGPPVDPEKIIADYAAIRAADPGRPVLLNLGQGVAWDGWHGRGVRTNHPEDYPRYVQGADIVSFDIYPVVHDRPAVAGKLWYVARGVERLREWTAGAKTVWNCIECTRISNPDVKPTPEQVKAEVWMSIVHGSRGLIYFCHQFEPRFVEAALLEDREMATAVGALNRRIRELAPVLASATIPDRVAVETDPADVSEELSEALGARPVAVLVKEHREALYIFAVRMETPALRATFRVKGPPATATIEVIGEDRAIEAREGSFTDDFGAHTVHIYRIRV